MHAYHGLISLINFTQYQTCFILQINASFYAYLNIADMKKGAIEDALVTATDSGFVLARRTPLKSRPFGFLPAF